MEEKDILATYNNITSNIIEVGSYIYILATYNNIS